MFLFEERVSASTIGAGMIAESSSQEMFKTKQNNRHQHDSERMYFAFVHGPI
jgi:hypothetical protein